MDIAVSDIEEIGKDKWLRFITGHPLGSVFHHHAWHGAIERTYGLKACYLIGTENGEITAALPFVRMKGLFGERLISYPFSDSCDPLVDGEAALIRLLSTLKGKTHIELRGSMFGFIEIPSVVSYHNVTLNLDGDENELLSSFHKDCVTRAIRKAWRSDVSVIEACDEPHMRVFYRLHAATRKRQGSPVQPFSFFKNLLRSFDGHGLKLYLAKRSDTFTAGLVVLRFKKTAYYKFGASLSEYGSTGHNQLLMWTAIKDAKEDGCAQFDFGRTFTGHTELLKYKMRWGGAVSEMRYACYPAPFKRLNSEEGKLKRISQGFIRALPAGANALLGRLIYKSLA